MRALERQHLANVGDCRALLIKQDETVCLTSDHNCGNSEEVARVAARTKDPNPVRPGRDASRDVHLECMSMMKVMRVAGTLAVTRAFGDAYLKKEQWAHPKHMEFVPYIVVEPDVHDLAIDPVRDLCLLLASIQEPFHWKPSCCRWIV